MWIAVFTVTAVAVYLLLRDQDRRVKNLDEQIERSARHRSDVRVIPPVFDQDR